MPDADPRLPGPAPPCYGMLVTAAFALLLGALPAPATTVSPHAGWDGLLQKHVASGRVDYGGMARDRAELERYLLWVADGARQPDLAFYLNARSEERRVGKECRL